MTYKKPRTDAEKAEARAASTEITAGLMASIDARMNVLAEQLAKGESAELLAFLRFTAQFHTYSMNNQILIWLAAPEARFVAGFHDWKALGRHVKAGAKAVRILAPLTVLDREAAPGPDGKHPFKLRGFKYVSVFADYDTEGEAFPEPPETFLHGGTQAHRDMLEEFSRAAPVPVVWEDAPDVSANGWTNGKSITLNTFKCAEHPAQALKTFFHEWAHVELHFQAQGKRMEDLPDRTTRELEAEAAAYVLSSFYGIEATPQVAEYITGWGGDVDKLRASLSRISGAVQRIQSALFKAGHAAPALAA